MRRTSASLGLAALMLVVVACSPDQPTDNDPEEGLPGEAAELAHAQCMRDHGIDWPDPVFVDGQWEIRPGEGIDLESPAFIEAEGECEQVRREASTEVEGVDPEDRVLLEEEMERMLEFAGCMRDQGIDFPDPQLDDEGISGPAGPLDGDWEAFDTARAICEEETGGRMD